MYASVNLLTIASDDDLAPCSRQAIISTNDGVLLVTHMGIDIRENWIKIWLSTTKW